MAITAPLLILIVAVLGVALVKKRYGAVASFALAMAFWIVGFQQRDVLNLQGRLHMSEGEVSYYLIVSTVSGMAVYSLVAGIQELRRMKGADGKNRPRP